MSKPGNVGKEIIMQGYLEKKSPKAVLGVRAWQKRYFELVLLSSSSRGNERLLYYYKSESDAGLASSEPLGEIVLNDIESVQINKEKPGRFDVKVPSRVFALKCDNPTELKRWVSALQSMSAMSSFNAPSHMPATPAETMKMMAQNSLSSPTKSNESNFQDATATIELMSKGSAFIKYDYEHVTEQTTREIVLLFYKKDSTPLGSLYFCEPGEKTEDVNGALALHTLTDMYLGKQSKAFRSPLAQHSEANKCFTALGTNRAGAGRELNLEGDSKEQVAAWLFGINAILTHKGGRKVMTAEDSEREDQRKRDAAAAAVKQKQLAEEQRIADAKQRAADEEQRRAADAASAAEAEAARAAEAAEKEALRSAASAAEKAAAEKSAADAAAAAAMATQAAQAAQAALAAASAASAAATAAAASAAEAPTVVRIRRKKAETVVSPSSAAEQQHEESGAGLSDAAAALAISAAAAAPAPAPIEQDETTQWLASLGDAYPSEYGKLFKDNGVDLSFLVNLSPEELEQLGVKNPIHLKKMLAGQEKLRESGKYVLAPPKPTSSPAPDAAAASSADAEAAAAAPVAPPTSEMGLFLYKLGPAFLAYAKTFEDNGVDQAFLLTLNDDDLEELGVSKLHRKRLVAEIKEQRALQAPAPPAPAAEPSASAVVGGYLARAQALKAQGGGSAGAGGHGSKPSGNMDDILAAIKEAKAKKASEASAAGPAADGIDLSGTSIAAIAARMAAQREARAKEKAAAAAAGEAAPAAQQ